jgi:hypothetical protein
VLDAIRRAKEEGLVQYIGFTGHDSPDNFIRCIETGLFDCLTIPYSLIQRTNEPTIKRAGELGVGVIAMCPVAGGILACESDKMKKALKMDMPTTEMALRFVLSNPDVSAACSGMTSMEQLEQNVKTVKAFDPEKDNAFEQICEGVERMKESLGTAICTGCSYCMPCEQGVNIPRHLELYRNWKCFGLDETVKEMFKTMPADQNASNCNECGACEEKCPNSIQIRETLKEILEWTEA